MTRNITIQTPNVILLSTYEIFLVDSKVLPRICLVSPIAKVLPIETYSLYGIYIISAVPNDSKTNYLIIFQPLS